MPEPPWKQGLSRASSGDAAVAAQSGGDKLAGEGQSGTTDSNTQHAGSATGDVSSSDLLERDEQDLREDSLPSDTEAPSSDESTQARPLKHQ